MEMKDVHVILHRKILSQTTVSLPGRAHCSLGRDWGDRPGLRAWGWGLGGAAGRKELPGCSSGQYLFWDIVSVSSLVNWLHITFFFPFLQTFPFLHAENHTFTLVSVLRFCVSICFWLKLKSKCEAMPSTSPIWSEVCWYLDQILGSCG